jgi:hypothetical protein
MTPLIHHSRSDISKVKLLVLPAVGPVRPKRRSKAQEDEVAPEAPTRIIIPLESERGRPARITRSGEPLQVWKAPSTASHRQHEPRRLFQDLARLFMRARAALS